MASGQDVRHLIPSDERIRYLQLPGKPSIGKSRNIGCTEARGSVVAHFDDDDWSHPERLRDQLRRLVDGGQACTGYHTMRFTDGRRWWIYRGGNSYALGTSLCYRRDWWQKHPFPDQMVGEDNQFIGAAKRERQLITVDAGELMYATIHPGNTSPRQLNKPNWKCLD